MEKKSKFLSSLPVFITNSLQFLANYQIYINIDSMPCRKRGETTPTCYVLVLPSTTTTGDNILSNAFKQILDLWLYFEVIVRAFVLALAQHNSQNNCFNIPRYTGRSTYFFYYIFFVVFVGKNVRREYSTQITHICLTSFTSHTRTCKLGCLYKFITISIYLDCGSIDI